MWKSMYMHVPGLNRCFVLLRRYSAVTVAVVCVLMHVSGCSPEPAEHQIQDAIHAYFKTRDLQVLRLEIRNIEREPLGARKYMGPERYLVHASLITLQEVTPQHTSADYQNVTITVRKNTASLYGWSVDNISGIPL